MHKPKENILKIFVCKLFKKKDYKAHIAVDHIFKYTALKLFATIDR